MTSGNVDDPDHTPFEANAYLFHGDDVWDQTAWLP
jgi:hypothetical protein